MWMVWQRGKIKVMRGTNVIIFMVLGMKIGTGMAWEKRIWVGFTDDISLDVEVVPSEEDAISDYHSIEIEGHLSDEGNTNTLV